MSATRVGGVVAVFGPGVSRLCTWSGETERIVVDVPPVNPGNASFDEWRIAASRSGRRVDRAEYMDPGLWYVTAFVRAG